MKEDTEEFPILSSAKPERAGAPSGFTWSANRGNGVLLSFDGIKKEKEANSVAQPHMTR
jgi:hypothetical protein